MITANITVNLSGEPQLIRVPAKQGDVGSREVSLKFVDNGVIYSIPEETTARIRVTKPDGKYVFNDCTIEDNAVIAPLTAQTLAAAGDAKVDIAMYQGENVLLSCSVFILAIMPRAGSDEAIESTDEFGALDSLLQQAETDIQAAHDAAEAANQAAESANEAAQTANDIAEEVEKKLENGDFVGPQGPAGSIDNVTGAATSILTDNLDANRALVSDGSGKVAVSPVTATELGYLDGVTSGIQGQLNGKQAAVTGAASTITGNNLTASRALVSDGNGKVAASGVTSTELGYLDGVTSGIQSQLNALNSNALHFAYGSTEESSTINFEIGSSRMTAVLIGNNASGDSYVGMIEFNSSSVSITKIAGSVGTDPVISKDENTVSISVGTAWFSYAIMSTAKITIL